MQRMTIKDACKAILADHGISKYRLAKILGVQQIMINKYLKGETKSVNSRVAMKLYSTYQILEINYSSAEELKELYSLQVEDVEKMY